MGNAKQGDSSVQKTLVLTPNGFWTSRVESDRKRAVKSKDTKPEVQLRKAVWRMGFRYRKNVKTLEGSPDLVFPRQKVAVFVDGDFWHGRNWPERRKRLQRNRDYWIRKIEGNIARDRRVDTALANRGWSVVRLWSEDVRRDIESCVTAVITTVRIAELSSSTPTS